MDKIELEDNIHDKLEYFFKRVEAMEEFKDIFGKPCKNFEPLCWSCQFWNKWNNLKIDIFEDFSK